MCDVNEHHPATLVEALEALSAVTDRGFTFVGYDGRDEVVSFAALHGRAAAVDAGLRRWGIRPGDRVALVLPDAIEFVPAFLGAVRGGAVPVPCYPPVAFGRLPEYVDHLAGILTVAEPTVLCTVEPLRDLLIALLPRVPSLRGIVTLSGLEAAEREVPAAVSSEPSDPVFLQFTSGSTARPKGVVVTNESLAANTRVIMRDALQIQRDDVGVSWLPLYHDMGLIGFVLAPIFVPTEVVFLPTMAFLGNPELWFDQIHRRRATVTFAPNFAFGLVRKRVRESALTRWDLSCLRVVGCGAEPINPNTIESFFAMFEPTGLRPESFLPCYGMAEATLAMAFPQSGEGMRVDVVDEPAYRQKLTAWPDESDQGRYAFVGCGQAVAGHELAVLDERGVPLAERAIGEIAFRGPSVTDGYFRNPDATAEAFHGDWLLTGDLGYQASGSLFITGRKKDLLVIRGRNSDPQHVEWVVEALDGVREGNVVAFTRPGGDTEELVVVLEASANQGSSLSADVRRRVHQVLQLPVADVVTLERGELLKTSSGKVQRQRVRRWYLAGGQDQSTVA